LHEILRSSSGNSETFSPHKKTDCPPHWVSKTNGLLS
jgi:hypothetical protein